MKSNLMTKQLNSIKSYIDERKKQVWIKLAREDYSFYCEYTMPRWILGRHLKLICREVQELVENKLLNEDGEPYLGEIIQCPPQHGKCVKQGTKVLMADGTYKNIEDIHPHSMVYSIDEKCYNIVKSKVLNVYQNGVKDVLKITLTSGREIICTENHPLLTVLGWKNAEELSIGNKIAVSRKLPFPKSNSLPYGYAKIMGYMVGDGGYTNSTYSFTSADEDVIEDIKNAVEYHEWIFKKHGKSKYGYFISCIKDRKKVRGPIKHEFEKYLGCHGSYSKRVPDIIMKANKKDTAEFIGSYFNCDGHVNGHREGVAEFYSVSRELLKDVQLLLMRFGIYSKLQLKNGKYNGENHVSYRLIINGQDLYKFYEEIPIVGIKGQKLKEVAEIKHNKPYYPEYNAIPREWKTYLNNSDHYYRINHNIRIDKKYTVGTDKSVVLKVAEIENNEQLKKICSDNIIWEKIISIEKLGPEPTYDIEVENTHNFITDGIITHNSQGVTETFVSWYMGKYPHKHCILIAYGDDLARRFGRRNKQKIEEFGEELFDIKLSNSSSSDTDFEIAGHKGTVRARGIMAGITGQPATGVIIIDDPVKNREEADSQVQRDKVWDEFLNSILTRLSAKAKVIIIMTRWHDDDLAGRVHKAFPKQFKTLNIPCEAEENDVLGRNTGDSLFPEIGKDNTWLKKFKDMFMSDPREGGIRAWNALFQGRPFSEEGNIFKKKWWKFYDVKHVNNLQCEFMAQSWDMSFTDGESSCRVAGQTWGVKDSSIYLFPKLFAKRADMVTSIKAVEEMSKIYPEAFTKFVENKANGPGIISMLNTKIGGFIPIDPKSTKEVSGGGSKVARAMAVQPLLESGNVYLPCEGFNPDGTPILSREIAEYMDEMAAFPQADYDDQCDSTTQFWRRFIYTILPNIDKVKQVGDDDDDDRKEGSVFD